MGDFTWNLQCINADLQLASFTGSAGNYGTDPYTWGIHPAIISYLPTLDLTPAAWYTIRWRAYIKSFSYNQTPTLYSGVLPKYKLGSWATTIGGWVSQEGFINYQQQYLCSGLFNTYGPGYQPYTGNDQAYPSGGPATVENFYEYGLTSINQYDTRITRADELYTQFDIECVSVLTIYCEVTAVSEPNYPLVYPIQL